VPKRKDKRNTIDIPTHYLTTTPMSETHARKTPQVTCIFTLTEDFSESGKDESLHQSLRYAPTPSLLTVKLPERGSRHDTKPSSRPQIRHFDVHKIEAFSNQSYVFMCLSVSSGFEEKLDDVSVTHFRGPHERGVVPLNTGTMQEMQQSRIRKETGDGEKSCKPL
jgi:hypothetical protein